MKLIPDGNKEILQKVNNFSLPAIHQDVTVVNRLFKLIISFRSRPRINDTLKMEISNLLIQNPISTTPSRFDANYPPNFILIGFY